MSPVEYLNSDWLKNIKQEFIDGKIPASCANCKSREDLGLKSTRGASWKFANDREDPEIDITPYQIDTPIALTRIEIRASNLCNFKCRMCNEDSSSEITKEKQKFNIPLRHMAIHPSTEDSSVYRISERSFEELKNINFDSITEICFTGGEPFLIKEYYDFMDFLIANKISKKIELQLYTNCSVYNPKFINYLTQFDKVNFVMSIDGVGKTAEYQRHGTDWSVVKENILKFNSLPFNIFFNTAVTSYVLLDVSSLAKFLMELYSVNNTIQTKCYSVLDTHPTHHRYMNTDLKNKAINEIDQAVEILTASNFEIFVTELKNIKTQLQNTEPADDYTFKNFTNDLDTKRAESFKDVFGYDL
jgi:hypothetical protein